MTDHDQNLARAFDSQAPHFERAPVQSDPIALDRLVRQADLPAGGTVLDAGCGPGLVSAALLNAGFRVVGVDLSREMIERARNRCAPHSSRADFLQVSVFDGRLDALGPFDGALSRFVLHHIVDPSAFVMRQVALLRPGGILVVSDHLTDPDPVRAENHRLIEWSRDHTHTRSLTGGAIVNLFAAAGLAEIRLIEETYPLDFDEWFDRGTPVDTKENVRRSLLAGAPARGFTPRIQPDGSIRIEGIRAMVRGIKPQPLRVEVAGDRQPSHFVTQ